mmetsp:Transcript_87333/g.203149  ORF Transcript_87333/g.203149 Transcript_87333/m.203149 type:complete len:90 (-) Transcript_87333:253-522(-)
MTLADVWGDVQLAWPGPEESVGLHSEACEEKHTVALQGVFGRHCADQAHAERREVLRQLCGRALMASTGVFHKHRRWTHPSRLIAQHQL